MVASKSPRQSPNHPFLGGVVIIIGTALSVGYVGFADWLILQGEPTTWFLEVLAIVWYVGIYACLVFGLWQMSKRAYQTKDIEIWKDPLDQLSIDAQKLRNRS